jgi:hypothetical protein
MLLDHVRGFAAWSADLTSTGPRRRIQVALGLVWVLDAALQFQPYMFTRAFATKVIYASAAGSPAPIAGPVRAASQLMLHNPVAWNAAFAVTQLALAVGLLWRPTARAALTGTIVWSLAVWWLGESLGGILTGAASPLSGAPGAVILYALLALLAWPARSSDRRHRTVADGSPLGARWSRILWLVLWSSSAYLILQAPNRASGALRASIAGLAAGEPRWIAALDRGASAAAGRAGIVMLVLFAASFAVIGVAIFLPAIARPALMVSIIMACAIWVIGENFGGILSGQATDPNTGPLFVLVALAFWPLRISRRGAGSRGAGERVGGATVDPMIDNTLERRRDGGIRTSGLLLPKQAGQLE